MDPTNPDPEYWHNLKWSTGSHQYLNSTVLYTRVFYNNHLISPNNFYLFTRSLSERLMQSKPKKREGNIFFSISITLFS